MSKVKNIIMYQIATDRNYKIGDKIQFGKKNNGQSERLLSFSFHKGETPYFKYGFDFLDEEHFKKKQINDEKVKDIVKNLSEKLYEADFVIRELALEEVRKKYFKKMPSRLKCMYLSDNKEIVLKNLKEFKKKGYGNFFQAIKVKLNGKIFVAKDVFLPRLGYSYQEYLELGKKYWSQDQTSTSEIKEILFEGEAEIIEILDEYYIK